MFKLIVVFPVVLAAVLCVVLIVGLFAAVGEAVQNEKV